MKQILFFGTLFQLFCIGLVQGQTSAGSGMTTKFMVYGNCGMCEARIEKAAKIAGVYSADWDLSTKMITIRFDETKVKPGTIHQAITAVGHDTDRMRGNDKAYAKLHTCCQYERPEKE